MRLWSLIAHLRCVLFDVHADGGPVVKDSLLRVRCADCGRLSDGLAMPGSR